MIRNVVMVRLRDGYDPAWLAGWRDRMLALDCPGTVSYTIGTDAGLREGNWSLAIVADFVDTEAYRGYDADAGHNALRAELAPNAEQVARVQFEF